MSQYRQILASLIILLTSLYHSNAQVVCSIDSVIVRGGIAESVTDFWDNIVPDEGPYIIVYSTIRNDGSEDVLLYTVQKNHNASFSMELYLQLEFEYQGRLYTNRPTGIWATDTTVYLNRCDYDLWGTTQEAFVLEPGQVQEGYAFWLNPFRGCELSSLESIPFAEKDRRVNEWNRLWNMTSEILPSLYIRMYTEIFDENVAFHNSPDRVWEAWTPKIITAR